MSFKALSLVVSASTSLLMVLTRPSKVRFRSSSSVSSFSIFLLYESKARSADVVLSDNAHMAAPSPTTAVANNTYGLVSMTAFNAFCAVVCKTSHP